MNPPAWLPDKRVGMMDKEEIDGSFLYPSIGLTLSRIEDRELSAAHCRAYNNWIHDFCSEGGGRLFPAVTLPWGDGQMAVAELKRTSGFGPRAVQAPNTPPDDMSYGRLRWSPYGRNWSTRTCRCRCTSGMPGPLRGAFSIPNSRCQAGGTW